MRTFDADVKQKQWHLSTRITKQPHQDKVSTPMLNPNSATKGKQDATSDQDAATAPTNHNKGLIAPGTFVPSALVTRGILQTSSQAIDALQKNKDRKQTQAQMIPLNADNSDGTHDECTIQRHFPVAAVGWAYLSFCIVACVTVPLQMNNGPRGTQTLLYIFLTGVAATMSMHVFILWHMERKVAVVFGILLLGAVVPLTVAHLQVENEMNVDSNMRYSRWTFFVMYMCTVAFFSSSFRVVTTRFVIAAIAIIPVLIPFLFNEVNASEMLEDATLILALVGGFSLAICSILQLRDYKLEGRLLATPASVVV